MGCEKPLKTNRDGDVGRVEIWDLVAREDNILVQPEGAEGMNPAQIWR